ncbi:MAG TPA: hypothetical protein VFY14_16410 [Streptomyces sp.]|nr:hypothetical protein [Streptomyces sp.]
MQRKAYATGAALVAVLAVGSVGCTGGSGTGGSAGGSRPGAASAAAAAPPGTYRDLPEPCGTVGVETLRAMLPGADTESHSPPGGGSGRTPAVYEGEPTVTYDSGRRVGCRWKSSTGLGSRHLLVDFERVVSYDPAVSDDERAKRLYEDRVLEAGVPSSAPSGGESAKAPKTPGETGKAGEAAEASAEDVGGEDVAAPPPAPSAELAPRPLEGVGDAAYLNDELVTADSGVHRDITLVFRTGNVIVTIEYEQWVADKRRLPDSAELQQKARMLAGRLAGRFDS